MSIWISSVRARLPHAAGVNMPSAARRYHNASGLYLGQSHPTVKCIFKYFPDLCLQGQASTGLLRSWTFPLKPEGIKPTSAAAARFMQKMIQDPFFSKALQDIPDKSTKSPTALFSYLSDIQQARALIILAGYSELFNASPFVKRPNPLAVLPKEVREKIRKENLGILEQADVLSAWIEEYSAGIQMYGSRLLTYSNPDLPIGVVPKIISCWPLVQVELKEQEMDAVPTALYPLLPEMKYLSLAGNPISRIPLEMNNVRDDAILDFSTEYIQTINADVTHPALLRSAAIQKAAERIPRRYME